MNDITCTIEWSAHLEDRLFLRPNGLCIALRLLRRAGMPGLRFSPRLGSSLAHWMQAHGYGYTLMKSPDKRTTSLHWSPPPAKQP